MNKLYLGDGVYAWHDGFVLWIQTEDGFGITNKIAFEPEVFKCLIEYCTKLGMLKS